MISRIKGVLVERDGDRVEVETASGVVYEIDVPLTVAERLPAPGGHVELRTVQIVRDDAITLCGFLDPQERALFLTLLGASGVGARLALSMLSAFSAPRLARALAEKDVAALTQVSGVGRKKAERIALELSDRVSDVLLAPGRLSSAGDTNAQEAVRALVALGYSFQDADGAVRTVLEDEAPGSTDELIRRALAHG